MTFGLDDNTTKKITGVFSKYPEIESVILYGSRAIGNYQNGSDIDLTIDGTNIDIAILSKITNDLDDLMTPYKFDLSSLSDIDNDDLLEHIKRIGIVFYKKGK